ncbi:MAG: SH3 domain-containing protein [Thiohalorhabdus sp.]|uniref:SH3 domain-containing protein n=1 Tax=Thiohalorhabdus sp. TaxID=3094134 RepID=UPI003980851A
MAKGRTGGVAVLAVLGLLLGSGAAAETFKSIDAGKANLRAGPGAEHPRQWVVSYGYPVRILDTRNGWARVEDYEGDVAWVAERLLSDRRTVLVTKQLVNVREGPDTSRDIVFQAEQHVVLRYLGKRDDWVHVQHADGEKGWVYAALVWGD